MNLGRFKNKKKSVDFLFWGGATLSHLKVAPAEAKSWDRPCLGKKTTMFC